MGELMSMGMILFFTFIFSFSGSVDFAGHLGGLVVGVLIGFLLFSNEWEKRNLKFIFAISSSILLVGYFFICFLILFLFY
jgi:membrane associated rhomboid family serine protease